MKGKNIIAIHLYYKDALEEVLMADVLTADGSVNTIRWDDLTARAAIAPRVVSMPLMFDARVYGPAFDMDESWHGYISHITALWKEKNGV